MGFSFVMDRPIGFHAIARRRILDAGLRDFVPLFSGIPFSGIPQGGRIKPEIG
jgi:hypothetical protein